MRYIILFMVLLVIGNCGYYGYSMDKERPRQSTTCETGIEITYLQQLPIEITYTILQYYIVDYVTLLLSERISFNQLKKKIIALKCTDTLFQEIADKLFTVDFIEEQVQHINNLAHAAPISVYQVAKILLTQKQLQQFKNSSIKYQVTECMRQLISNIDEQVSGTYRKQAELLGQELLAIITDFSATDRVKKLIAAGANLDARSNIEYMQDGQFSLGDTCLLKLVGSGHPRAAERLQLLIKGGANLDIRRKYIHVDSLNSTSCHTALIRAVCAGIEHAVDILIKAGAHLDVQDERGRTALMHASAFNRHNIIELLIQKNADVNEQDSMGLTAAMHLLLAKDAALLNTAEKIKLLTLFIDGGADFSIKNKSGKTFCQLANYWNYLMPDKLKEYGVLREQSEGCTLL